MKLVLETDDVDVNPAVRPDPRNWSVVIPAAGKGSRLGFSLPKILYPIGEETILDRLLTTFQSLAHHIVLVISPSGRKPIEQHLRARGRSQDVSLAVQDEPKGMAHAVLCAQAYVSTPSTVVVWGDQATVSERTARLCMNAHEARINALLTFPTVMRADPYIHVQRDGHERIVKILQKREGEISASIGENDCGIFMFDTQHLFRILKEQEVLNDKGAKTGEYNLIPLLPLFDDGRGSTQTLRVAEQHETLGVNTPEEGQQVDSVLSPIVRR